MELRILHILDHSIPVHSGYTFRTRAILEQQRALGWKTYHMTSPKHPEHGGLEQEVSGLKFYRTPGGRSALSGVPVLGQLAVIRALERRLEELVETIRPDVLHAHSPALNGVAAVRVGRRRGIPVVYEVRAFWEDAAVDHGTAREGGVRYRLTRSMETYVLERAAAVTTICEGLRRDMVGRGIPEERITVIPNAVDLAHFAGAGARDGQLAERLGLRNRCVIGFIGSFYAYEGLDLLVEAMPAMLAQRPDLRLLFVGGGVQEEYLKSRASALGVGDRVVFAGRVPHDEVQKYYDLVDVLVYPRRSMRLTELVTPLKPLEAMAQGRLVAASDVGGHRELIVNGATGVLFSPDDPQALADALGDLLGAEERWPALRAAGRRFVEEQRNWPASVARYAQVYETALGPASHGRRVHV